MLSRPVIYLSVQYCRSQILQVRLRSIILSQEGYVITNTIQPFSPQGCTLPLHSLAKLCYIRVYSRKILGISSYTGTVSVVLLWYLHSYMQMHIKRSTKLYNWTSILVYLILCTIWLEYFIKLHPLSIWCCDIFICWEFHTFCSQHHIIIMTTAANYANITLQFL